MAASSNNKSTVSSTPRKDPKVLVIGAGISGLACARELQHRNYDVLVVEARSNSGGRLRAEHLVTSTTTTTTTTPVDVGGALVHGITNNPVYQMIDQMGITTVEVSDCLLLHENGTPVDPVVDQQVSTHFNECLEKTFEEIHRIKMSAPQQQSSFGTLFDRVVQDTKQHSSTTTDTQDDMLFRWHQANLELSGGTSFGNLGYDWNDDEPYEYTGAHVALQQGWNAVTEELSAYLDILYNAPIASIQVVKVSSANTRQKTLSSSSSSTTTASPTRKSRRLQGQEAHVRRSSRSNKGVAQPLLNISDSSTLSYEDVNVRYPISNKHPTPKVHVTLQNGKVLQADAVVCTLPLGILKLAPSERGHVEFDPPLVPKKQEAIQSLGCGLLNKCVLSFANIFWQDSEFLGVVDDPPNLILNASIVTGRPILVFMFGGDLAFQVEDMTDVQIVEMCMNVLRKTCAQTTTAVIPDPMDYVVTRWGHDVYARGAFVYIPPGVEGTKQLEAMSEPIVGENGQPLVLFAGEHTTPFHPSTIHGAFLSGIREAYRLDLNLFPDWNNHLVFEPDHLYKKTFPVKRKFQNTAGETNNENGSQPPPRRRRHGVMTLRKRSPATYASTNGKSPVRSSPADAKNKTTPPSRRSNRIAGEPIQMEPGRRRRQQDDRTLVRAYESLRDWQVIDDKVFPVYGADPNKCKSPGQLQSPGQLRARYQQLKTKPPRLDSAILATWLAPKEASSGTKRVNGKYDQSVSRKSHRIDG